MKNRGMFLEEVLSKTSDWMLSNGKGLLINKPIDIAIASIKENRVSGFLKKKSTTDFYGCIDGKYYEIEAKQTNSITSFPLSNLKEHQFLHLENVQKFKGKGFLIIHFFKLERYFMINVKHLSQAKRKSISIEFLEKYGWELKLMFPGILNFHKFVSIDDLI